ncbi:MAG: TPM domain-containing protein [Oscillospiraceae bacterium]|jgi:uncharacterized protein|nr:TPM domain-containing protein [Oscillospiraceae bacterium]
MKFIKSRGFAIIVLAVVIIAVLITGYRLRANNARPAPSDVAPINYTAVYDNGNLLSKSAEQSVIAANEVLYAQNGRQIIIVTDKKLPNGYADSEVYSRDLFDELSVNGILLYFTDRSDNRVYLSYSNGVGMSEYKAESLLEDYFYRDYYYKDYNSAVTNILPALNNALRSNSGSGYTNTAGFSFVPAWWVALIVIFVILLLFVLIFAAIATGRRNAYVRGPRYIRTDPFPSWYWFLPGFYAGSRYRTPRGYRPPPPPPPPGNRNGASWGGAGCPGGFSSGSSRPSRPSSFGGGAGRTGGFSGGGGRSSGGGGGRSGGFGGGGGRK